MKAIEIKTGLKRKEIEKLYISSINKLVSFGMKEDEARKIVQETLKETLGL